METPLFLLDARVIAKVCARLIDTRVKVHAHRVVDGEYIYVCVSESFLESRRKPGPWGLMTTAGEKVCVWSVRGGQAMEYPYIDLSVICDTRVVARDGNVARRRLVVRDRSTVDLGYYFLFRRQNERNVGQSAVAPRVQSIPTEKVLRGKVKA